MSEHKLCEQYGFDDAARAERLTMLGLADGDSDIADLLSHNVIAPNVDSIVDRFYEVLLANQFYTEILDRGFDLDRLRQTQTVYLLSMGQDYASGEYFEERLRVGLAHARIGLPLSLYECAYNTMRQLILGAVPDETKKDVETFAKLVSFLSRITSLDMSLAIETYHLAKIHRLEQTLETLQLEDEELRYKIATDSLTQVASHSQALVVLDQATKLARRKGSPLCVCMIDLDHFKKVNDTYGHLTGDAVLRDVASRMQASVRTFDTIGRYGGEEFIIILENTDLTTAQDVMERLRQRVANTPINVSGTTIPVTVSGGLAALRSGDTVQTLIARSDAAMYGAKHSGRNKVFLENQAA